jgi:signal transduction histidine kinase
VLHRESIRVLIVEDDFMVSAMIRGRVEDTGYTVLGEAQDGVQAIELVQTLHPDVVLMDIEMPNMNGIEATQHISEYEPTPVVILSAFESPELVNKASEVGAGAYLVKPPNARELERGITIALARFKDMQELRQLNQDLDAFAHTTAHELQTPLSLIRGYTEILQSEITSPAEHREYLDIVVRNTHKMSNIIRELLLLTGVRKTNVETAPLNMKDIVAEARQRLTHLIQTYQTEITLPQHWPKAMGHALWVEEVWVNYLSNGIKYGGKPPRLQLGATENPDGTIKFWVQDNGLGLTQEEQLKLFAPFTRLDQVQTVGYGLGLSIVRRIIEKLGGQTGVESEGIPGKGSLFYFTLPAAGEN